MTNLADRIEAHRAEAVEAMLIAEHQDCPVMWPDAYGDGVARIKRMKMEWALDGLMAYLAIRAQGE